MMVFKRRPGESFRVGEAVVTVVEASRGSVKLGVTAPPEVAVMRSELEPSVTWRGSVTDLVTDVAALLTAEQLQELACEATLAWRAKRSRG